MAPTTPPSFPPLPPVDDAKAALVCDERAWPYRSACAAGGGIAHLRVWNARNGHVAIVTETGLGASTTNSAEEIWDELTARFPGTLVVLEHWPAGGGDDHDRLDQVGMEGRRPTWRRIWPTAPANPDHHLCQAWMQAYGHELLAVSHPTA
ncbi:hypothetical protein [Streptomyces sp. NPDC020597]|uniref:hypothetical protein n=1 Tax=unclassified Streptomyces TaxID=2593676 RepID=UPI0037B3CF09